MAKNTAIKDEQALAIAKSLVQPTERWTAAHHARFIWKYFRQAGFLKDAKPEAIKAAGAAWEAMYNNARIGYASNQAKGLAEAGVCTTTATETAGEYE